MYVIHGTPVYTVDEQVTHLQKKGWSMAIELKGEKDRKGLPQGYEVVFKNDKIRETFIFTQVQIDDRIGKTRKDKGGSVLAKFYPELSKKTATRIAMHQLVQKYSHLQP